MLSKPESSQVGIPHKAQSVSLDALPRDLVRPIAFYPDDLVGAKPCLEIAPWSSWRDYTSDHEPAGLECREESLVHLISLIFPKDCDARSYPITQQYLTH